MLIDQWKDLALRDPNRLVWIAPDSRADQVKQSSKEEEQNVVQGLFADARVIDATGIHGHIDSLWGESGFQYTRDCKGPLPPYQKCAIEVSPHGHTAVIIFESGRVTEPVSVPEYFLKNSAMKRYESFGDTVERGLRFIQTDAPLVPLVDAKWVVSASVMIQMADKLAYWETPVCYVVDGTGEMLTTIMAAPDFPAEGLNKQLNSGNPNKIASFIAESMRLVCNYVAYGGMVLSLMTAQNVELKDGKVSRQIRRDCERKKRLIPEAPMQIVITVPAIKPSRRGTATSHQSEDSREFRGRRGHLADYREKGLFGKWKGIYYFPEIKSETQDQRKILLKPNDATIIDPAT